MDQELLNTFKDQFALDCTTFESKVNALELMVPQAEAINALFRIAHNLKASTQYLKIIPLFTLSKKVEVILNTMRDYGVIETQTEIEWLKKVSQQFQIWSDELDLGIAMLSTQSPLIESMLKHQDHRQPINALLKSLNILYIDDTEQTVTLLTKMLKPLFNAFTVVSNISSMPKTLQHKPDIIFIHESFIDTNSDFFTSFLHGHTYIPIVAIASEISKKRRMHLMHKSINYLLMRPIQSAEVKKILYSLISTHFTKRKMIISNKKINEFITHLEPLSQTLVQIQEVCDDPSTSIADLTKVIKNDPVTTGIILHATKSPIYAFKSITTIDQAVSIFGKRTIKALTLCGLRGQLGSIDLSPYGISEARFSHIAQLRLNLMQNWYSKIDNKKLHMLSISSLLGSLGQILIAKEILRLDKSEAFLEALHKEPTHKVEYDFLRTTTEAVTSDILYFWKISSDIIDSISYAHNPFDAVDEIIPLAVANHVVFSLIPLNKERIGALTPELYTMLDDAKLDPKLLKDAIEKTNHIKES